VEKGAMPWSHRYIGNPVLSFIGRLFFRSQIKDFHCGLRGYNRKQMLDLGLRTTGMEYASEMVVMSELNGLKICEVPTTLKKDGRSGKPHLRSFRDGWRHLKFLFMYSPKWLFLYPGILFTIVGLIGSIILSAGRFRIGAVSFSIHTLLYCTMLLIVGVNIIYYYIFAKLYAEQSNFIPHDKAIDKIIRFSEDKGILIGIICVAIGIITFIIAFSKWETVGFSELDSETIMRLAIPSATLVELGVETVFASFLIGIFKIKRK
jgi:hypothetical protein